MFTSNPNGVIYAHTAATAAAKTEGNNMITATYEKANYSGETAVLKMTGKKTFKAGGFKGAVKTVSPIIAKVILDGEFEFTAYLSNNIWFCKYGCVSRENINPIVACLQVAHNVI